MARSTWPGPTRRPAALSVRAKWTMLLASLPRGPSPPSGWPASVSASTASPQRLGGDVGLHLAQDLGRFRSLQALDVVLILEQYAQGVIDGLGVEVERVELRQRRRPVDRFGNARRLEEVEL